MLDIYICEDDIRHLKLLKKFISDSIMIEALDMQIRVSASDPHTILENAAAAQNTGVFFLDIDLKSDINGLELAQQIRQIQPRCYIIFITSHSEMSFLSFQYKVEALDFIIKDTVQHVKEKIHECLLDVHSKHFSPRNTIAFIITYPDRYISIDYKDILFFETSNSIHKIVLHTYDRLIEFNGHLKDLEKQLDYHFYRCHRSYMVNLDNISDIDFTKSRIRMKNNELCPISVRSKNGLKKAVAESQTRGQGQLLREKF